MSTLVETIKTIARTFENFTERGGGIRLRPYQSEPGAAILKSIREKLGLTFVVIISRQAGKDELLANLIAYLMTMFAHREVGIVVANPTYKPQTLNFLMRLENRLKANLLTRAHWKKRADYMRYIGSAVTSLLSGDKDSNVVGATASLLLVINEAQDISPAKYDKDFAPMVASTNATRIIVGTQWTSNTLLAREEDAARQAEKADGIRRVFMYTADDVRRVNKSYGQFVDAEIRKLGRQHPLVKTQYFCERIDAQAGMFNAKRLALMAGDQSPQTSPQPGHTYAFLIDVAGQDEAMLELEGLSNPGRDKTTLRVIDIDLSSLNILQAPIYRAVKSEEWQGENHVVIFSQLSALADVWHPLYIIEDATGAGEGLAGMLATKYPPVILPDGKKRNRFIPFKYTAQSKSELGYGFLAVIESGRFRDCCRNETIEEQYIACQSEILIGPAKTMRWGVPDGTRGGADKHLIHDDYITTDALTAELDKQEWYTPAETIIIEPERDVLEDMNNAY